MSKHRDRLIRGNDGCRLSGVTRDPPKNYLAFHARLSDKDIPYLDVYLTTLGFIHGYTLRDHAGTPIAIQKWRVIIRTSHTIVAC